MGSVKSTHKRAVQLDKAQKKMNKFLRNKNQRLVIIGLPDGKVRYARNLYNPDEITGVWLS